MSAFFEIVDSSKCDILNNFEYINSVVSKGGFCGIKFPKGVFRINTHTAVSAFKKLKDFEMIGDNTTLIFEGDSTPLKFENCENITLKGITIQWKMLSSVSSISFSNCKNITIIDVTIHSGGGIAVENSENINVHRVYIKPEKGKSKSLNGNAIVFNDCKGLIHFHTCYFDGIVGDVIKIINCENMICKNSVFKNDAARGFVLNGCSAHIKCSLFKDFFDDAICDASENNYIKIIDNRFLNCKNIVSDENNIYIDESDNLVLSPVVFAVGKEYQIMQPMSREYIYAIKIGDKIYYDEINGIIRSDCDVHRVSVPMCELDIAKKYTVLLRKINDRIHNTPICSDEWIEKTYNFKPVSENPRAYYIADSHNLVKSAIAACKTFGDIDFLILNGDLQCYAALREDFYIAFYIASELTNGEIPVIMGRGNHETIGRTAEFISDYMPTDCGKVYFTFTLGDVWGMVLDCGSDHPDDFEEYSGIMNCDILRERQIDFIKRVISNADNEYNSQNIKTKLIISHIPFTDHISNKPDVSEVYSIWQQLIEDYIKPNIMISGHTHKYSVNVDKCVFPLIIASENTEDTFGGTGFIFTEDKIVAINTNSHGIVGEKTTLKKE